MTKFELIHGDITKLNVDAIVNAAHTALLGGGGVDGAIHRVAGRDLFNECITLNGCPTGQAKITKGYKLPAKYIIHTVGPIWSSQNQNEVEKFELLKSCYTQSLLLAKENNIKSIAFPTISCGAYRCPKEIAVKIAFSTIVEFIQTYNGFEKIIFIDVKKEIIDEYYKLFQLHYYNIETY